jgi:hypothetical protein
MRVCSIGVIVVIGDREDWRMCIIVACSTAHCGRLRTRMVVLQGRLLLKTVYYVGGRSFNMY